MFHKTYLFAFILVLFAFNSFGQDSTKAHSINYNTGVTASYHHQSIEFLSIGGIIGQNYGYKSSQTVGTGICLDISLNQNITTVAPRLFLEGNTNFAGFRINLIDYTRNGENDLRFMPEINLTYLGLVNLSGGYSFYLLKDKFKDIGHYRISLTFNFVKKNQ